MCPTEGDGSYKKVVSYGQEPPSGESTTMCSIAGVDHVSRRMGR